MRRTLTFLVPLLLLACKGPKESVGTTAPVAQNARPDWVRARPVTGMYYVGIGQAPKNRADFMETAKRIALNDLASEISVVVEGNSLLHTLDQGRRFDESFSSTIRTTTNEQIEGFELVDSWENGTEYHVYYRLSKAEHARIKAERKRRAMEQALDLFTRSRTNLSNGDLRGAFDMDLRALLAIKEYWGEADMVELDGRQVPLANEIYSDLQRLASGTTLTILPERCRLTYADGFRREMLIKAAHANNGMVRDLPQLPLMVEYPGQGGRVTENRNTNHEGHARTVVQRVRTDGKAMEMIVRLDMASLVSKEIDDRLVRALVANLTVPEKRVPIDLDMPRVFMRATETNLGVPVHDAGVALAIREELSRIGFRFVERESDADMLLDLQAATRQGGEASGFFTTFLDVSYSFRDRRSREVVFEGGRQGVKGVQLDFARAGIEAYKRAVQEIRQEVVPSMLSAIM